jgi:hypothetical protein
MRPIFIESYSAGCGIRLFKADGDFEIVHGYYPIYLARQCTYIQLWNLL